MLITRGFRFVLAQHVAHSRAPHPKSVRAHGTALRGIEIVFVERSQSERPRMIATYPYPQILRRFGLLFAL